MTDDGAGRGRSAPGRPTSMLAFERIEIRRLPGFERGGFELRGLSPGINLLHGPQAAGKSTTARVLAGLLWPDDGIGVERWEEASVSATAWIDGRRWEIDAAHARPRYQEEGEPRERLPVPGGELSDRYSLALHDLLQAGADDGAFARLIARELAGGFDLDEALHAVEAKEKPGRATKESKALKEALDAFRETEARQIELAGEAAKLDRLRADEAAAHAAARELEDLLALATWRRCQERLALEERALEEGFGPIRSAMERVAPTDLERLDRLGARLAAAELDLERKREAMRQTETRLREAALPPEGVPRAVFGALGQEQKALLAEEAALAEGESALARFRELREDARHALGEAAGDDETLRALPAGAWGPLLELAAAAERVRARQAQLDGLEDWLGGVEPPPDLPSLTEGINRLRRWLRASASSWRPALLALVVAFLLAAFGAWAGAQGEPAFWGLAALGAAGASWALLDLLRSRVERRTAAREYTALGIEAPARWAAGAVEPLLARLELRRAEALLEAEKAARYQEANARRRRLDEQEAELAARRRALVDELGLATVVTADLGEAPLAVLAQALCAWRVADSEVRGKQAETAERRADRDRRLAAAGRTLAAFGYPLAGSAADLAGQLEELTAREGRRADASELLQELSGEDGSLAAADRAVAAVRTELEGLFADRMLDPGDRAGLARRVKDLPTWKTAEERAQEARWALVQAEAALPDRENLRELDEADLTARRADLERAAARERELSNQISVIEDRVRRAKVSHDLEEAAAELERARWDLRQVRERDADAAAAEEVGRWLRENLRDRRRPTVLTRAAQLFTAFTRGRYRLLDPTGEPPALRALETATELGRGLEELSSGTRLQLLLAIRIAYIEDREVETSLPLVLDETLATSDDWSSRAIIDAVVELAREGRQVFFMTAKRAQVAEWSAALDGLPELPPWTLVDLGEIRRLTESADRPRSPSLPEAPAIPAPEGLSREEYADLLGVPGIDPWLDGGSVHLWHLVPESEALHRLLARGLDRWGQLRALAEERDVPAAFGEGDEGERRWRRTRARGRCIELLCRAWREGRGRPVDRSGIVASGAVTETFLDRVCGLAAELGGSGTALVEALRTGAVPRFQKGKIDLLKEYLEAEGYLDLRDPLDEPALRAAAFRKLAAEIEAGHLSSQDLDELLAHVLG